MIAWFQFILSAVGAVIFLSFLLDWLWPLRFNDEEDDLEDGPW